MNAISFVREVAGKRITMGFRVLSRGLRCSNPLTTFCSSNGGGQICSFSPFSLPLQMTSSGPLQVLDCTRPSSSVRTLMCSPLYGPDLLSPPRRAIKAPLDGWHHLEAVVSTARPTCAFQREVGVLTKLYKYNLIIECSKPNATPFSSCFC